MAQVTDQQIAQFAADAGFTGPDLEIAIAVAIAESTSDTAAIGDVELQNAAFGPSVGLWQIRSVNPGHGNAFDQAHRNQQENMDPATNAANAYAIQQQKGWKEWSTYKDDLHLQHMDRAKSAAGGLTGSPDSAPQEQNLTPPTPPSSGQGQGQGGSQGFLGELQKLMESIGKLLNPAETLNKAGQAAGRAAASSAAFGKVQGSSAAHQKHASNTQKYGEHACRGSERVRTQSEDIRRSASDYETFSRQGASDIDRTTIGVREDMINAPIPPNVA